MRPAKGSTLQPPPVSQNGGRPGIVEPLIPRADRLRLEAAALNAFLLEAFPLAIPERRGLVIEAAPGRVRLRSHPGAEEIRPGGLVSGPTQMALADLAAYALVLGHVGPVAMAVTSSFTMHFLRGCEAGALHADAVLMRLGRRNVVLDVRLWTQAPDRLSAQATLVYALPDPGAARGPI